MFTNRSANDEAALEFINGANLLIRRKPIKLFRSEATLMKGKRQLSSFLGVLKETMKTRSIEILNASHRSAGMSGATTTSHVWKPMTRWVTR